MDLQYFENSMTALNHNGKLAVCVDAISNGKRCKLFWYVPENYSNYEPDWNNPDEIEEVIPCRLS